MPLSSGKDVLDLADAVRGEPVLSGALRMLAAAEPGATPADLGALPVGERNARLLRLRQHLFGPVLSLSEACPACAELVEIDQPIDAMLDQAGAPAAPITCQLGADLYSLRAITSADLAAVANLDEPGEARAALARRVVSDPLNDDAVPVLLEAQIDEIAARLARLDPFADLVFLMSCPVCEATWEAMLDPADLLLRELDQEAETVLEDVHELASQYHWSEAQILSLSPARREAYLARVRR